MVFADQLTQKIQTPDVFRRVQHRLKKILAHQPATELIAGCERDEVGIRDAEAPDLPARRTQLSEGSSCLQKLSPISRNFWMSHRIDPSGFPK